MLAGDSDYENLVRELLGDAHEKPVHLVAVPTLGGQALWLLAEQTCRRQD
jgi:hypothetical protein